MASVDSDANSTSRASSSRELKRRRIVQPDGEYDVEDLIVVSVPIEERPLVLKADSQSTPHTNTSSDSSKAPGSSTSELDLAIIRAREALAVTLDTSKTMISIPRENNQLQASLGPISGTSIRQSPKPDGQEASSGVRPPPTSQFTSSSVTSSGIAKSTTASSLPSPLRPANLVKDEDSKLPPSECKRSFPSHCRVLSEPHSLTSRIADGRHNNPTVGQIINVRTPPVTSSSQFSQPEARIPSILSSLPGSLLSSKTESYQEPISTSRHPPRQYPRVPEPSNGQATIHTDELVPYQSADAISGIQLPPLQLPLAIKGAFNKNQSRAKGSRAGSRFDTTAKVLIRQRPRAKQHRTSIEPDTLLSLPIGVLMSRELTPFFEWYCFKANSSSVGWLKFEFLDVDWQPARIIFISRSDYIGYASLKSHVSNLFYIALNKNPDMTEFRISISADGDTTHIKPSSILTRLTDRVQRAEHQAESTRPRSMAQSDHRQPFAEVNSPDAKSSAMAYSSPHLRESPSPVASLSGGNEFSPRNQAALNRRGSYGNSKGFLGNEAGVPGSRPSSYSSHMVLNSHDQQSSQAKAHHPHSFSEVSDHGMPEIVVLLQQADGKLSQPYPKDVLHPRISSSEFFSWFGARSGFGASSALPELQFTFKDALPVPKTSVVARGNEDHFNYMRADIKTKCERAKWFHPAIKEFVVLVTLPGWESAGTEMVEW
ncbi:hypothetical protein F5884DRAFT_319526 [Xylogone sp. PMI_703]|nr:hypothetical protein F5884DRAFT_319526 [Xylogone sp. PMI_703]